VVISRKSAGFVTLTIFALILILTGVAGFIVPAQSSLTSGAPAYNIFHICFGTLGLLLVWFRKELLINLFNAGFGLIDLYQAAASFFGLPPQQLFLWTRVDDVLHILIGVALVLIGGYGFLKHER
jgi:hypothetical protein